MAAWPARPCRVTAKFAAAAITGTVMQRHGAERQAGPVMVAENPIHRKTRQQPVGQHGLGAAITLFGGLEDEVDRTVPIRVVLQQLGRTKQRGGVAVMAAGMHHPAHGAMHRKRLCIP